MHQGSSTPLHTAADIRWLYPTICLSCVAAMKMKTFKSLAESLQLVYWCTISVDSVFILQRQKLHQLKGTRRISRATHARLYRVLISHLSPCFWANSFITNVSCLEPPAGTRLLVQYARLQRCRDLLRPKDPEQKARSSVCEASSGSAPLVGLQFHLRLWIMHSFSCSARGLSAGQALRWRLRIFTFPALPAFCAWPATLEEDENDNDMKSRNVALASERCYLICNHLLLKRCARLWALKGKRTKRLWGWITYSVGLICDVSENTGERRDTRPCLCCWRCD